MSDLVLYTNPQSRGRIAHWMMEELGLPYETVWLEFGPSMKTPEYLAINPMGKVPTLRHGEVVVTETAAICTYLADRFPERGLIPPAGDPARGAFYRWLFFAAGPLETAVATKALNWAAPAEKRGFLGFGCYEDTLATLEHAVAAGPYLCGDRFSAADLYVASHLGWGMMFGTIEKRPAFEAYVARHHARPAAQAADRINDARMAKQPDSQA